MIVQIKDCSKQFLEIGDRVDYLTREGTPRDSVLVIGLSSLMQKAVVTWEGISNDWTLSDNPNYYQNFNIDESIYPPSTRYICVYFKSIDAIHYQKKTSKKIGIQNEQQLSAWGKPEHVPPPGAPFEFL